MTSRRQISLPEDLCSLVENKFAARFENLESLLEFVLKELTRTDGEVLDQAEQALLEERLKNLGYM